MSLQFGNLLIYRQHLTLSAGVTSVTTGIRVNTNNSSPDPTLPERLMIEMLPPVAGWTNVTAMSEPYLSGSNLIVDFFCPTSTTVNVLFWLPHSLAGPLSADAYGSATAEVTSVAEACCISVGGI